MGFCETRAFKRLARLLKISALGDAFASLRGGRVHVVPPMPAPAHILDGCSPIPAKTPRQTPALGGSIAWRSIT